ncbi:tRNA (adenine(22)-N(1))-methyltransferase [Enhygromyxa salina]|uniref:tRNA (Adenine(22)-N(1))-methyltransferase n=1 Tax=Enhygromyxa salina TaxID=215803 RepID=A0A2S9YEC7_9BACT|nr:class I SAM-dependent methyltransferase [Enhygromyxa salina]PRQ03469.1 tRNA (adenine(22)-N(1))-methyltransferase [Enhygromyxa salina]
MSELGPRLGAIAERVLPGLAVADLCCDHARLAVAVVACGRAPRAIAGDINSGPLAAARRFVDASGLAARIELREGDGLAVLNPGEVGTVVIAGIGAPLAERLLRAGAGALVGVRRLIVQANHGFPKLGSLRACLRELGWGIVDECLARDQGRLYVIVVAEPGEGPPLDERDRELGPILRSSADPLLGAWIEHERERVTRAVEGMLRGRADAEQLARHRRFLALLDRGPAHR